jgi:hypothetical protein
MRKMLVILLTVLVFILLAVPALAADVPQKVLNVSDSVLYVEASDVQYVSSGSAFVIQSYTNATYLITNYHVVKQNINNVSVWISEKEKTNAEVLKYSEQYDLAMLKIGPSDTLHKVTFSEKYGRGESVYAIGFPAAADYLSSESAHVGKDATITDGVIGNIRTLQFVDYGPEISILQINADLNPGNSGGPLINGRGQVIGINTLGITDSQGIFGSISVTDLKEFLNGTGVMLNYGISQWLIAGICAGGVIILLAVAFMIKKHIRRKKPDSRVSYKKSGDRLNLKRGIPLEIYLEHFSDKLNPKSITSLMMPVALSLRDKHLRGELSLRLSPKYLKVTEKGCVIDKNIKDDGFVQQRFLSPEQLSHTTAGVYSDIYAYCAIMEYMLSRVEVAEESTETEVWKTLLEKRHVARSD